ncbi:MAG: DUF1565 domain-containing protein [Pseudomonadota bacterium]
MKFDIIFALLVTFLVSTADADNLDESNLLFDWAQISFPKSFSPANSNTYSVNGYLVRYFSDTHTYLGTKDNITYVLGDIFGGLVVVGSLSYYIDLINSLKVCNDSDGRCTYYVSPDGDDSNKGSITNPFVTIEKAISHVKAGDTIYLRAGIYSLKNKENSSYGLYITKNGSSQKHIKLWAYPGEKVELVPHYPYQTLAAIKFTGDYWHFKGFSITGIKQWLTNGNTRSSFNVGFDVKDANHNIFELIESHHNEGIGFYLGGNSNDNLVLNADFHHNGDPLTILNGKSYPYGHADGIHIRVEYSNTSNIISGTRAWNNSDDGFDTWFSAGIIKFENNWAFFNGYKERDTTILADGNGFKLGPMDDKRQPTTDGVTRKYVQNCLAYNNLANGFDYNGGEMPMKIYNNTSYKNGQWGYTFKGTSRYILKNNISFDDLESDNLSSSVDQSNNTWNSGFNVSERDFISLVDSGLDGSRNNDGSLPNLNFLKLRSSSHLKNAGVHLNFPYLGEAPDLGY